MTIFFNLGRLLQTLREAYQVNFKHEINCENSFQNGLIFLK